MLGDTAVSFIRTYVPVVIGTVIGFAAKRGFEIEINTAVATAAAIGLYYAAARILEKKFPSLGWLLGVPKQPAYALTPPA